MQEGERALKELEKKLNPRVVKRKFYKISLQRNELDHFRPKSMKETNISLVVFEELD
jgi:hypothetical protein